ncbi:MAG: cytosine deaminase [Candidatus Poriferisodalaceae bacterium]
MIFENNETQFTNARLPGTDTPMSFTVSDGIVTAVEAEAIRVRTSTPTFDLSHKLVIPGFVEPHAHLDKAFTADLVPNPAGDLMGAINAWKSRYHERTEDEIFDRALRAVELAVTMGVTSMRTHVDVGPAIGRTAVDALVAIRDEVADIVDLQIVALVSTPLPGDAGAPSRQALTAAIEAGADLVGGCPHLDDDPQGLIDVALDAALDAGIGLDLHVDETLDPTMLSLELLARTVLDRGIDLPIAASHCVSLSMQPAARQREIATLVARAGIGIVALPQTNLFLQARGQTEAPPRGITPVSVLRDAGVLVAAGGDNVQDPFNLMGRGDPFETAALMVMAGHLDPGVALETVGDAGRSLLGLPQAGVKVGMKADLVAVRATTIRDAVASAPAERTVIRGGRVVAETALRSVLRPHH